MAKKKKAADKYPTADDKKIITPSEIKEFLKGKEVIMPCCGRKYKPSPQWGATMIIQSDGQIMCHD